MDLTQIDNDFSKEEKLELEQFVKNGCMGLERIAQDEPKIHSMFNLYMSGKGYKDIARILNVKKTVVLYMSAKMKWYDQKINHFADLQKEILNKAKETKLESVNFIAGLIACHHKYYGDKFDKFLATGDKTIMEDINFKELAQYFKSIEVLEKILNPNIPTGKGGTTVNINTQDGSTVKQVDNKTLEITPSNASDLLKQLVDLKNKK